MLVADLLKAYDLRKLGKDSKIAKLGGDTESISPPKIKFLAIAVKIYAKEVIYKFAFIVVNLE